MLEENNSIIIVDDNPDDVEKIASIFFELWDWLSYVCV